MKTEEAFALYDHVGVASESACLYSRLCGKKRLSFLTIRSHGLWQTNSCVELVSRNVIVRSVSVACGGHLFLMCSSDKHYSWSCLAKGMKKVILHFLDSIQSKKSILMKSYCFLKRTPVESAADGSCSFNLWICIPLHIRYINSYTLVPGIHMHCMLVIIYLSIRATKVYYHLWSNKFNINRLGL